MSLLLKKKGSMRDVNNAPELIETRATDTFETFMAEKKKIQWSAINTPPMRNFTKARPSTFNDLFLSLK